MRNLKLCKKCYKKHWLEQKDKHLGVTTMTFSVDFDDKYGVIVQTDLCKYEKRFDETAPPPEQCPYILEHSFCKKKKPTKKKPLPDKDGKLKALTKMWCFPKPPTTP